MNARTLLLAAALAGIEPGTSALLAGGLVLVAPRRKSVRRRR